MSKTNVICILPVKNEAWILKNFIECAKAWADFIIIGDHNSTDGSASIAREYDCVKVIPLRDPAFDAGIRRKILLEEARNISGKRLIITVDADEMISANWADSPEWDLMLNAEPGTGFHFDVVYLLPGLEQAYVMGEVTAFMDDGTEYRGTAITEPRAPVTAGETIWLQDIKLLHYVNIDPQRMLSKQQWYQCIELIELGTRPWAASIKYPSMGVKTYGVPVVSVKEAWLRGYDWLDEYRSIGESAEKYYWWDEVVLNLFDLHGVERFRKVNIWGVDWNRKAQLLSRQGNYTDPRSRSEVWVHKIIEKYWDELKMGQASQNFLYWLLYMFGRVALRPLGW